MKEDIKYLGVMLLTSVGIAGVIMLAVMGLVVLLGMEA